MNKIKVSDYIVDFYSQKGINIVFSITGGFAMHLNDSFGKNNNYKIYYNHHEQACAYSAFGYTKTNQIPSIICTTAGTAAVNAIPVCLNAYQDSLPLLFISGQVTSSQTLRSINNDKIKLRHYSGADCDIISMVSEITKYSKEILDIENITEILNESYNQLITGRPGPVWLSIPVDIQGMYINFDNKYIINNKILNYENNFNNIHELLSKSKRPLIIAGNGIKLSNCVDKFNNFINKYNIPVVVSILGTDIIETNHNLYHGKIGLIGDRHGNFTLQNCDLLISLGCRLSQGIVGYRSDWFVREAKIILIDIDNNELLKTNINYTLKIYTDLNLFFDNYSFPIYSYNIWIEKCNYWKKKWIFEIPNCLNDENGINPYLVLNKFYNIAPSNKITLCSAGSIVTNVWHMINIKKNDKFIHSSQGDMGMELPSAIGAQIAEPYKMVIPIIGDGSFQLNIQELQTIIHYKLPIKIMIFNNGAYGAIKITQNNFFKNKFGVDKDSGISFPDTEKIAYAYGIKYLSLKKIVNIDSVINEFIDYKESIILEIFSSIQTRYPKLNAIKNDDGTFTNRPFEDMDPFLDREEFKNEMIVNII